MKSELRKALIAYLEEDSRFLACSIYTPPVPVETQYPWAALQLETMAPRNDPLNATGLIDWKWALGLYGNRFEEIDAAAEEMIARIHRPGLHFEIGTFKAGHCRVNEVGERVIPKYEGSEILISVITIKFSIITQPKGI